MSQRRTVDVSCKRSIHQESGIAQSAYVAQGFSPVAFAARTDGTVGTVEKQENRTQLLYVATSVT